MKELHDFINKILLCMVIALGIVLIMHLASEYLTSVTDPLIGLK